MRRPILPRLILPPLGLLIAATLPFLGGATANAQEILLGNLFAGAGPFATLARTNEIAAQMAVEEINAAGGIDGRKIELIVRDTQSDPTKAVNAVAELTQRQKVAIIFGPLNSGEALAATPSGSIFC